MGSGKGGERDAPLRKFLDPPDCRPTMTGRGCVMRALRERHVKLVALSGFQPAYTPQALFLQISNESVPICRIKVAIDSVN